MQHPLLVPGLTRRFTWLCVFDAMQARNSTLRYHYFKNEIFNKLPTQWGRTLTLWVQREVAQGRVMVWMNLVTTPLNTENHHTLFHRLLFHTSEQAWWYHSEFSIWYSPYNRLTMYSGNTVKLIAVAGQNRVCTWLKWSMKLIPVAPTKINTKNLHRKLAYSFLHRGEVHV